MLSVTLLLGSGLAAGLAASPHCLLMCGALQQLQQENPGAAARPGRALLQLHVGRILGYALLGALAAAAGQALMLRLPAPRLGLPVQALAALVLVVLGLRQWRARRTCPACPGHGRRRLPPLLRGLAWAALPCGTLYAMLFLAAVSGGPGYGALLLAAFGLGTLPLLGGAGLWLAPGRSRWPALLLVALGLSTLLNLALATPGAELFCRIP